MADTLSSVSVCLRKSATPSSSSELVSTSLRLRLPLRCQRLIPACTCLAPFAHHYTARVDGGLQSNSQVVVCCE